MDVFVGMVQNLRYGLRSLRSTPRLTFAALACIALGLGSAVFMLTLIDAVLIRSAPFPNADRLVRIWTVDAATGGTSALSYLDFEDVKKQTTAFEALEMVVRTRFAVMTEDGAERMRGEAVTPRYFELLAIKPAQGRLFAPEEYARDASRVMLISHDMWQRKFGGRQDILGQVVRARSTYEGQASIALYTIAGVMPPGFVGTVEVEDNDFWIPVEHYAPRQIFEARTERGSWTIGLLKPGVSLAAVNAEVQEIGKRLAVQYPGAYEAIGLGVEPFGQSWREKYHTGLLMLLSAAVLLLLIACTNIANFLLARLAQREHELTLRLVLGAERKSILGQLVTESLLMSVIGGVAGALLASWGIKLFVAAKIMKLPNYVTIAPDLRVIAITAALILVTGLLFGVLPAWFGSRVNPSRNLRDAGRTIGQGRRQRTYGQFLVILEVSFTFILLIGSVLMLRTYLNLIHGDVGYRTENLLRMAVSLDPTEYPDARAQLDFVRDAKARLGAYPGVRKVSLMAGILPPWFDEAYDLALKGVPVEALRQVSRHAVDSDFFETMDIALLRGRAVRAADRSDTPQVGVVSQSLGRFMAGGDGGGALGMSLQVVADGTTGELSAPVQIVGVVKDIRYNGPLGNRKNDFDFYVPIDQALEPVISLALFTSVDPATLIQPLQRELGRIAPTSPQHWISTMKDELALQYGDARFYAWLTGIYAVCAVLLAILGIYGVLANSVSRRFGELGVRMAIGAQGNDIVRLVLAQGMKTLGFGLAVGATLAIFGGKLVASLLYGVAPSDPVTFVAVASALLLLGLIACYVPARRAGRADPMVVLRGK